MSTPGDDELVTVRLDQLPLDVQTAAQQHGDELTRELMLVAEQMHQQEDGARELPHRFVELVTTLNSQYSMFTAEQEHQLAAAVAAGDSTVDLVYRVPASVGPAAASLGAILDEADAYCREGRHLLTLATPPEALAYRQWYLQQFVDQIAGRPAQSWREWLLARPPAGEPVEPPGGSGA
jgi:hypothetical protein